MPSVYKTITERKKYITVKRSVAQQSILLMFAFGFVIGIIS
jgi:hypothetical protein